MENRPTASSFLAMGKISAPRSLPRSSDWLPSRKVVSVSRGADCFWVVLVLGVRAILRARQRPALLEMAARHLRVVDAQHPGGEPGGVPGPRLADRHRGDRDPGRHLDDGVERVD